MNRRLHASVAAFVLVYAGSAWTAWPGLSALDGGDFITAGAVLGVPHATGFPVHVQLTGMSALLPLGNLAWRGALMSAFFSGVAAAFFTWWGASVAKLGRGSWAVVAAVCVAFFGAETLVLHARVTEVYALNLALVGVVLVALERLDSTGDLRWRTVAALACGIGLANHALFRLWFVPIVVAAIFLAPVSRRWRGLAGCVLIGAASLFAYGYLLASAGADPPHNWGDPSTFERWWAHITARDIRSAFADQMMPNAFHLQVYGRQLGTQMASGLGLLAPVGLAAVWARSRPRLAVTLAVLVAIELVYSLAINPMGLRDFQNGQLLAIALGTSAGATLGQLSARIPIRGPFDVVAAVAVVVGVGLGAGGHRFHGSGADWSIEDLVVVQLGVAEPEAIVAPVSDSMTAGFLYALSGLGARPDAFGLGRYLLSDDVAASRAVASAPFPVVSEAVRERWSSGGFGHAGERGAEVLQHNVGVRAIYWEVTGRSTELPTGLELEHRWPLGMVAVAGAAGDECVPAERSWCDVGDASFGRGVPRGGYFYRRWAARQRAFIGARYFRAGEYGASEAAFGEASELNPEAGAWLTGVALSMASTGRLAEAMAVQERALVLNPLSLQAHRNALLFAEALRLEGRMSESERAIEALRAD